MPLIFDPPLPKDIRASVPKHPPRRVFCTGCGVGRAYDSHEWIWSPEQIESWIEEHKDHKPPAAH